MDKIKKNIWKNFLLRFIIVVFIPLITLFIIIKINQINVAPSNLEIKELENKFQNIEIKYTKDVFRINSLVVKGIKHKINLSFPLDIRNTLRKNEGYCYDRSLILQKIFIHNKIPIRPVFIYYYSKSKEAKFFDLIDNKLLSHSVFEFQLNGKWYIMETNSYYNKLLTLEQYISMGIYVPKNSKFLRYVSNRNGAFISPRWIPDIYYFNF